MEEQFPDEFREWVNAMVRYWLLGRAGFDLMRLDLPSGDWRAIAEINRYYEVKDLEATIPRTNG